MDRPIESSADNFKVYFEPGLHPLSSSVVGDKIKQVQQGHDDVHAWNWAVHERMRSYNPDLIAIDGLEPFEVVDSNAKMWLWLTMPGKPSQINGTEEVLVVAGDNTYNSTGGNSLKNLGIRLANIGMLAACGTLGGYFIGNLVNGTDRPQSQAQLPEESKDKPSNLAINRRRFFRNCVAASVFFYQPNLVVFSPWRFPIPLSADVDDISQSVSLEHIIDPDHEYEYLEGRTALLISKIHDAALIRRDINKDEAGSVVMGDAHTMESNNLLSDPTMRAEYIKRHTALMLEAVKRDRTTFEGPWTAEQKQQWLINQESKLQIFRVEEPDDARFKQDPIAELERIVTLVDNTKAPSVVEAIKSLS